MPDTNDIDGLLRDHHADLCALVAERNALRQALQRAHAAMVLAKTSHGCLLLCDPPIEAWKGRCVDAHLGDAIRECAAALRKGESDAD